MTEDEARKKVCKRHIFIHHNQEGEEIAYTKVLYCIASDCMMWVTDADRIENAGGILSDENRKEFSLTGDCGLK